jgi:hypothetical protein
MPNRTQVYLPTGHGLEKVWVQITSGTKAKGVGIITEQPKAARIGRSKIQLGDEIEYSGGNSRVTPHLLKRLGNKMQALRESVAEDLKQAMMFKPAELRRRIIE